MDLNGTWQFLNHQHKQIDTSHKVG